MAGGCRAGPISIGGRFDEEKEKSVQIIKEAKDLGVNREMGSQKREQNGKKPGQI